MALRAAILALSFGLVTWRAALLPAEEEAQAKAPPLVPLRVNEVALGTPSNPIAVSIGDRGIRVAIEAPPKRDDDMAPPKGGKGAGPENPKPRIRVIAGSVDPVVFGDGRSSQGVREFFDALADHRVERIDRLCLLTEVQKKKLRLAARGDVQRFFDRIEDLRGDCRRAEIQVAEGTDRIGRAELARTFEPFSLEARDLRILVDAEPFRTGPPDPASLLAKTLRTTLTAEQTERYQSGSSAWPGK